MATKKISYDQAYSELQEILEKLENDELDVDKLSSQVRRASELIRFCKSRLFETEAEIEQIIREIV